VREAAIAQRLHHLRLVRLVLQGINDFLESTQHRLEHVLQSVVSDKVRTNANLKFIQVVFELLNSAEQLIGKPPDHRARYSNEDDEDLLEAHLFAFLFMRW